MEASTAVQAHVVAYGSTVDFALQALNGANSIAWSIVGTSKSDQAALTITPAGAPSGMTASCVMPSDPGDGLGRAFIVKLLISDGRDTAVAYRVFGAVNSRGEVPAVANEENYRSATHGYTDLFNKVLATVTAKQGALLTGAAGTPGQTITVDQGALRVLPTDLAQSSIIDIDNTNAIDEESITIASLNTAAFTYTIRDHSNNSVYVIPASTPMAVTLRKATGANFANPVATRL